VLKFGALIMHICVSPIPPSALLEFSYVRIDLSKFYLGKGNLLKFLIKFQSLKSCVFLLEVFFSQEVKEEIILCKTSFFLIS
jgi:hypothetical protein